MILALVIMGTVSALSLAIAIIAVISAEKANKSNSAIASQFVDVVLNSSDRADVVRDGEHVATSFSFPDSEGF